MSNSEAEKDKNTDKTDGIVWQTTKPKLIARNYSTGNLQSLENRVAESESGVARPELSPIKEQRTRRSSLSSLFMGNTQPVFVQKSPGESFFKELMEKYDQKKEQEKKSD